MLDKHVKVGVSAVLELGVQVGVSGVLPGSLRTDVAKVPSHRLVGVQVLEVNPLGKADPGGGLDELLLELRGTVLAIRNVNRPVDAVRVA